MIPTDIIQAAFWNGGIISLSQTIYAEDMYNALFTLNNMLNEWNRKRWIIYHEVDVAHTMDGSQSYTVGTGGDFNVTRPDQLEEAYVRLLPVHGQPVDFPLYIINNREDYSKITLKQLTAWPSYIFYDSDFPLGRVYPWPIPTAGQYEVHIVVKDTLLTFANLTTTIVLPPEYFNALVYNLAERLRASYKLGNDPQVSTRAATSLNTIKNANTQIPTLSLGGVPGTRRSYDWTLGGLNGLPFGF